MGGISTQEEIVARLDKLDLEEININKQLRELQIELNGIVPVKDRIKVKKEYFDDISIGEIGKHQENQDNDIEEIENENLEDLEEEEDEDVPKKRKKKKIKIKSKSAKKITKKNRK